MRILHVANFSEKKYGKVFYATDRKISNGFIRNGHFVYNLSDRDVARQETIFKTKRLGRKKLNDRILETIDNLQPELLLLGHTDLIYDETFSEARKLVNNIRIAQWFVDPLFVESTRKHLLSRIEHIDALFCTTAGNWLDPFRSINKKVYYLPNPVDPSIESLKNDQEKDFEYDLIYCGIDYKDPERSGILTDMQHQLIDTRFKLYGSLGNPPIFGANYIDALGKSKMGLNLSRSNDIPYYSSDRIAQLSGNGLLVFMPETPGFENLYTTDEIVYFNQPSDLIEKIHFFNSNDSERIRIAQNGRIKSHTSFSTSRVAKFITEITFDLPLTEKYEWESA
jgi:spore maturation protein CgeB